MFRCGLSKTDTSTLATLATMYTCLCAWGAVASVGWSLGWFLPVAALEVLTVYGALNTWFNTLTVDVALMVQAQLSVVLHVLVHIVLAGSANNFQK